MKKKINLLPIKKKFTKLMKKENPGKKTNQKLNLAKIFKKKIQSEPNHKRNYLEKQSRKLDKNQYKKD